MAYSKQIMAYRAALDELINQVTMERRDSTDSADSNAVGELHQMLAASQLILVVLIKLLAGDKDFVEIPLEQILTMAGQYSLDSTRSGEYEQHGQTWVRLAVQPS